MTHDPKRVWYFSVTVEYHDGRRRVMDGTMTEGRCRTRGDLANAIRASLELHNGEGLTVHQLEVNEL